MMEWSPMLAQRLEQPLLAWFAEQSEWKNAQPRPVWQETRPEFEGEITLVLFGLIATAGLRILSRATMGQRELLIVGISLGLGLGVETHPEVLKPLPPTLGLILGSGISTGGMCALILNLILPRPAAALSSSSPA
jgi:hypothetical protein